MLILASGVNRQYCQTDFESLVNHFKACFLKLF